jgi:hypothetical protein
MQSRFHLAQIIHLQRAPSIVRQPSSDPILLRLLTGHPQTVCVGEKGLFGERGNVDICTFSLTDNVRCFGL